ncbi:MAG: acyl-CoA dehydrogenase family protein [Actinomycetes bacterium]
MDRDLFDVEHEDFRVAVAAFVAGEVGPYHAQWEKDGIVDRSVWAKAGAQGLLGTDVPVEYGGGGSADFRFNVVVAEELIRAGATGVGFGLHNDVVAPYLVNLTTEAQRRRWLPGFCSGQIITAIAMTEPGAGSDLAGITTTAVRDHDGYVLNGSKTFITNGINADLVLVVAQTDPGAGAHGLSLLAVERGTAGFERGRRLEKIGLHAQDTAELFFHDVHLPAEALVGTENKGFIHLMENLPRERLSIAVGAVATAETVMAQTISYVRSRRAFGQPIGAFQNTRFTLAEMSTEVEIARSYVDRAVRALNAGRLDAIDAAKAKWWTTEMAKRVVDSCLQLFGGYGYMLEYPVAKAFLDTRVTTIYGGTTEIMKEIIGRSLEG